MAFGYNKTKATVRPVKKKKEKLVKPNVNELKRIYRILSRQAEWTNLDTICTAMLWWDNAVVWLTTSGSPNSKQAGFLNKAFRERRQGNAAKTNNEKLQHYVTMIRYMERAATGYIKVPSIAVAVKKSQGFRIKLEKIKSKMAPKFGKLINVLHGMFPNCPLEIQVVPHIRTPDGVEISRKFDHALGKMYYSRAHAKSVISLIRNEGLLAVAIQESFFLSRAMSFEDEGDGSFKIDTRRWIEHYGLLLSGFLTWAKREDTPKRLVKKIAKKKPKKVAVPAEPTNEAKEQADA